ncbi:MAG: 5'-methylthioadenosine/adenosylhomocysteine nucleosidase [Rhodospirillaceae bacterium]|nr:5'-methylthioadenosine/adenosylhomocysteine nucleosidase [Rhodospirillaceae bacterium]
MLAVMGAMEEEVALLRGGMRIDNEAVHAGINVIRGIYKDTDIALVQCGIGKVNAAICSQMLIDLYKPDRLLFSGVAGGLLPNMAVGDLIIASHLIQFDVDLTAFGRRHGELPDQERMIQSDPDMVQKAADAYDAAFSGSADGEPNLMIGTIVSGDRFVKDSDTLRWLQREFSALATEMEGAAVGYTCGLSGLPFVVIRGLSDTAGESASDDFSANLHKVCQSSHRLLEDLIPRIGG